MDSLFTYSLTVSVTLAVMWLSYRIALFSQKNFAVNRAVLLIMLVASLALYPLLIMSDSIGYREAVPVSGDPVSFPVDLGLMDRISRTISVVSVIWAVGAGAMLLFTLVELVRLIPVIKKARRVDSGINTVYVTDDISVSPFSLGKMIVINSRDYDIAGDLILCHESGHIRFYHSLDMLLTQIVTVMCWYNPVVWLFREDMRAVHEYQADAYTLSCGYDLRTYQLFLIGRASGTLLHGLGSRLNHGKLRKRIEMMKKRPDRGLFDMLRYLVPAGALVIAVALVSNPTVKAAVTVSSHAESLLEGVEAVGEHPAPSDTKELPDIYVDGVKIPKDKLNDIPGDKIRSITIEKNHKRIDVELNK